MKRRIEARHFLVIYLVFIAGILAAAEINSPKSIDEESLPFRTALHQDPTLDAPLQRLLSLYRTAHRTEDLFGIYRTHLAQYPDDINGHIVLIRLLAAAGSPEAIQQARTAIGRFPKNAFLRFLLYGLLHADHDRDALNELDKAIELEVQADRKIAWIDELVPLALNEGRRELAEKNLRALAALADSPQARLAAAQRMNKYKFYDLALEALERKASAQPTPEAMVAIELEAATAEVGLNRAKAAGARLDRVLSKLTADYWRRSEIIERRLALVENDAQRNSMIEAARHRVADRPDDESAALDLAQILSGLHRRGDALNALLDAGRRIPKSEAIEKQTLDLFDRTLDDRGRAEYLARRIKQQPERKDLLLLQAKTLYLLGRRGDAAASWKRATEGLDAKEKLDQTLEMARFLRRNNQAEDAAEMFRQVVQAMPGRSDIRRELAELYLASGNRTRMRELLSGRLSESADTENVMDLVQFMIREGLLIEAKSAIKQRIKRNPENLDLQMVLLTINRRMGSIADGKEVIAQSRPLADTGAKYKLWLESAVAFFEEFDAVDSFLNAERMRLDQESGEWNDRRRDRRLAYVDACAAGKRLQEATTTLKKDLASNPPDAVQAELRRRLIDMLEKDQGQTETLRVELEKLARDDPAYAEESNARLALLYARNKNPGRTPNNPGMITNLLAKIDVKRISDATLLSALLPLYQQYHGGNTEKISALLERLTDLNPTDRSKWQQWLTVLATMGDEDRLRTAIRRLLAGIENMSLSEETRSLLNIHLAESYWRSISKRFVDKVDIKEVDLADILTQLSSVERIVRDDGGRLWVAWMRAFVLNKLGRQDERDVVIADLQRVASSLNGTKGKPDNKNNDASASHRMVLPDGLTASVDRAIALLSSPEAVVEEPAAAVRKGLSPPFSTKWIFDSASQAPITSILSAGDLGILICDATGDIYCIDAETGKLKWRREGVLPVTSVPMIDAKNRLYVSDGQQVRCYSIAIGVLLWSADIGAIGTVPPTGSNGLIRYDASLFLYGDKLLTYEPVSGTVTQIEPDTGKIAWVREFQSLQPTSVSFQLSGASLSGDRLLIYGSQAAIVNLKTGQAEWTLDPWRVNKFPIQLGQNDGDHTSSRSVRLASAQPQILTGMARASAIASLPTINRISSPSQYSPAPTPPAASVPLTAPAVAWASQATRIGNLIGSRLLLSDLSNLYVSSADFPLISKKYSDAGIFVGTAGNVVVTRAPNRTQLNMLNIINGESRNYGLQELAGQLSLIFMDGSSIYAIGAKGILCVNALTGTRVFLAPWPEGITLPPGAGYIASLHGITPPPGLAGYIASSSQASSISAMLQALSGGSNPPQQISGSFLQAVGLRQLNGIALIDQGVLYTAVSPTRVVALAGQAAHE